jgi:hypothetical protein
VEEFSTTRRSRLYRVDRREKSFADFCATEYSQQRIDREVVEGKEVCFALETQGFFDRIRWQKSYLGSVTRVGLPMPE